MQEPDQRKLLAHIAGGRFQAGAADGRWDHEEDSGLPWPMAVFWIAAASRERAPDRYFVRLDCRNYPTDPPTGTFWDPDTKGDLATEKRPTGTGQVEKVFRIDWENGRAFYHPYDRVAAKGHPDWPRQYPYWVWDEKHTIVDLLSVLHGLLNSREYRGVRS